MVLLLDVTDVSAPPPADSLQTSAGDGPPGSANNALVYRHVAADGEGRTARGGLYGLNNADPP